MTADYPYLCPHSRFEAANLGQSQLYMDSFRLNVECARAIEQSIRDHVNEVDSTLGGGCAQAVLDRYGFTRTIFVLANSVNELQRTPCAYLISDDTYQWGQRTYIPEDGRYNHYFAVDTAAALLEAFIGQTRDAYQALGLFGPEHCAGNPFEQDYTDKVLVMRPETLRESCWHPRNQLWLGEGGFGCDPHALGQAVYAVCLGDGERTRWNRTDFAGILDERYLPDWAREKLEEIHLLRQEQTGSESGGMMMK